MKKIMFNDKCGLTKAVLEGRKTQTRRIAKDADITNARYKIGEEVAVAQSYQDAGCDYYFHAGLAGWDNKMFVRGNEMPHRIKITNIRVERLQNISDEDCLQEGVSCVDFALKDRGKYSFRYENEWYEQYHTPQEAFADLIGKTCGKKTWNENPWVFVYEFELVK